MPNSPNPGRQLAAALALVITTGAAFAPVAPIISPAAHIGQQAFSDRKLSASGRQSCASCHDPNAAFAPANAFAVQSGGRHDERFGIRAVPSIAYARFTPKFRLDAKGEPVGGLNLDGRADTLQEQARGPLLNPLEMANTSKAELVKRLRKTAYASEFKNVFGKNIFKNPAQAFDALTASLAAFQRESKLFAPFNSKYDAYLAGGAKLNPQEARGLALFEDPQRGNCAACHPSANGAHGEPPLFTDFSYDAVGVPRNRAIPAMRDGRKFDLGLCGPERRDLESRKNLCGAFKTPTVRNVALRKVFFHNGRFNSLEQVLDFYVRRDTNRDAWYKGRAFDDQPKEYIGAINLEEAPYKPLPNGAPRLTASEKADIVAFLKTLTDDPRPR